MNENHLSECEQLQDLLPAYSLGVVDPDEKRWVETVLPRCPDAAAELASYHALGDALALAVPQVAPPAHLHAALMQAARPATPPAPRMPRLPLGLAAMLVLISLGLLALALRENARLTALVGAQSALLAHFAGEDVVTFPLADTRENGSAQAVVLCHPDETVAVVRVQDFPALPETMRYRVWLWRDGARTDSGVITVNADGDGTLVVRAPLVLSQYQYMGIVAEPLQGAAEQGEPLVRGPLYPPTPPPSGGSTF